MQHMVGSCLAQACRGGLGAVVLILGPKSGQNLAHKKNFNSNLHLAQIGPCLGPSKIKTKINNIKQRTITDIAKTIDMINTRLETTQMKTKYET